MPKRSRDPLEKARRNLAEAQLELHLAQERRIAAIAQGEREVRAAQQRAARRTLKATERLEKRAGAVVRAEARLYTLSERIGRLRTDRSARKEAKTAPVSAVPEAKSPSNSRPRDGQ